MRVVAQAEAAGRIDANAPWTRRTSAVTTASRDDGRGAAAPRGGAAGFGAARSMRNGAAARPGAAAAGSGRRSAGFGGSGGGGGRYSYSMARLGRRAKASDVATASSTTSCAWCCVRSWAMYANWRQATKTPT